MSMISFGGQPRYREVILPARALSVARHSTSSRSKSSTPSVQTPKYSELEASIVSDSKLAISLFDNAASAKIYFSYISMYLPDDWQRGLFSQIDRNLNIDLWEEDSSLFDIDAFKTFLRFAVFARPVLLPAIGIGPTGHLLASWRDSDRVVSVEFMKKDAATAVLTKTTEWGREAVSWLGHVASLKEFVKLFGNVSCLEGVADV